MPRTSSGFCAPASALQGRAYSRVYLLHGCGADSQGTFRALSRGMIALGNSRLARWLGSPALVWTFSLAMALPIVAEPGRSPKAIAGGTACDVVPPSEEHTLWRPLLSRKSEEQVRTRLDRNQVTYYLSDLGRWSKARSTEEISVGARYVAKRVVRAQLDLFQPRLAALWQEVGIGLRTGARHTGEPPLDGSQGGHPPTDLVVGIRSGRPFLQTRIAGARVTIDHNLRSRATTLTSTCRFGSSQGRVVIRQGPDGLELRLGVAIPLRLGPGP